MKRLFNCILSFLLVISSSILAQGINKDNVKKDMLFLSSDDLKGRQVFTPEIDTAADYIAKKFSEFGLQPLSGESSLKQTFNVYKIIPSIKNIKLNQKKITKENSFLLTTHTKINWTKKNNVVIKHVNENDNLRKKISEFNKINKNLLVLVNKKHKNNFLRYRKFFTSGSIKFKKNSGPSAVFLLSDVKKVDSLHIDFTSTIYTQKLTNVIGVLKGTETPRESIIFSAHYDHLGKSFLSAEDKVFNGANDNASGTTAVINLAKHFAIQKNNQRSLILPLSQQKKLAVMALNIFLKQLILMKLLLC